MTRISVLGLVGILVLAAAPPAGSTALQLGSGDTGLLFGGTDAEGGIGDWYLSNGVIEVIIDDVGPRPDLVGVVPAGTEPPIQAEINPTGGTLLDFGTVGADNDQLNQMFTVGGLSTENFVLFDTVTAPASDTISASGKLLLPPSSPPSAPCIDLTTEYKALGTDPFLTVITTATNSCAGTVGMTGFLDAFVWTLRGIIPFSGGPGLAGGRGFNHPVLNLASPGSAIELPTFMAGPGTVRPADGIMDPANSTTSGEVSYGLVGVSVEHDADGPGGAGSTVVPVNSLFGVSSTLVTALGNFPVAPAPMLMPTGTFVYTRRIYVGGTNDVASVSNGMLADLAARPVVGFATGTISGDVDAADTASVPASILITRTGGPSIPLLGTGGATSHVRTDATGAFSGVVLGEGVYSLTVSAPERPSVTVTGVTVSPSTNTVVSIPALAARATVTFTIREKALGLPLIPGKLVFKGVSPTPDPRFNKDLSATLGTADLLPETFGGTQAGTAGDAAGQSNVVYSATGSGSIQVAPGTYDVWASRGLEYQIAKEQVVVPSGGSVSVDFVIKRVVKTPDAISADFHVHSGRSLDASAPLTDRVRAFVSEGVEVMVSTDHDKHVDYAPIITSLGVGSHVRSIIGNEVTGSVPAPPHFPNSYGHINAWPVTVAKDERSDGGIQDEYVAPNWLYKVLRDQGAEVIQYNHPRAGVSGLTLIGLFNNIGCNRCANDIDVTCTLDTDCPAGPGQECTCVGYQPDRTISMVPNDILLDDGVLGPGTTTNPSTNPDTSLPYRNIDFDVMEVMNATKDTDFVSLREVRRDWLSLLNQGILKPGTAVSDSHRNTIEHAGWARTFVLGVGDDPATLDVAAFNAKVKAGATVMSGGPYIEAQLKGKPRLKTGIGETMVAPAGGAVRLKFKVKSPKWIPYEEVRVIQNGFVVASYDDTTSPKVRSAPSDPTRSGTLRFRARLDLTLTSDAYFIVEAGPKIPVSLNTLPTPPPAVDIIVPDVVPMAITNPLYVDLANDGFDPPGLPVMTAALGGPRPTMVAEAGGVWDRLWSGLAQVVARLTGEAVAEEAPGEMTGVTKEEKEEAVREGEYFPLHEFSIPPEVVEEMRRQHEEATRPSGPAAE